MTETSREEISAIDVEESIISLILVLPGSLRLLAALDAGALVIFLFTEVSENASLGAVSLKSLKSTVQRLVFLDMDFAHSCFPPSDCCGAVSAPETRGTLSLFKSIAIIKSIPRIVNKKFGEIRKNGNRVNNPKTGEKSSMTSRKWARH